MTRSGNSVVVSIFLVVVLVVINKLGEAGLLNKGGVEGRDLKVLTAVFQTVLARGVVWALGLALEFGVDVAESSFGTVAVEGQVFLVVAGLGCTATNVAAVVRFVTVVAAVGMIIAGFVRTVRRFADEVVLEGLEERWERVVRLTAGEGRGREVGWLLRLQAVVLVVIEVVPAVPVLTSLTVRGDPE